MNTIEFLRQFRLGGYAIFDFAASFLGIYLLSPFLSKLMRNLSLDISRNSWILLTLPLSIGVHLLSKNITRMTSDFLDPNTHYTIKILILALLVLGIKDIKIVNRKPKPRK